MARPRKKRADLTTYASLFASLGGKARTKKLSKEQRHEIAKKAARARWAKTKSKKAPES